MSTVYTFTGSANVVVSLRDTISGDVTGSISASVSKALRFAASGADAVITGFFQGTATCAAGDWLLAHATDPLGSMGSAEYSPGFTVAGSKLKLLYIENMDDTRTITVARRATAGLAIFDTAGDSVTIQPGGCRLWYDPTGLTAALTTTSNDGLTIAVSGGTPTATVLAMYGS